jgi:hypothetical protein
MKKSQKWHVKSEKRLTKSQKWLSYYSTHDEIKKITNEISRMLEEIKK